MGGAVVVVKGAVRAVVGEWLVPPLLVIHLVVLVKVVVRAAMGIGLSSPLHNKAGAAVVVPTAIPLAFTQTRSLTATRTVTCQGLG